MMSIIDLPGDLVGEIFSRVPLTSLSAVRSTCKTWNDLSKHELLGKKAARKNQFLEFMKLGSRVCSLRFDLQGFHYDEEEEDIMTLINQSTKQISIPTNQVVNISQVHHCDGLLLCVTEDDPSRLLVWNPYLGQIRWIQPRSNEFDKVYGYALGYDSKNRNHKIMRFFCDQEHNKCIDVYDISSDSWRVLLDVYPEGHDDTLRHLKSGYYDRLFYFNSVSLKGNTYFFGQEVTPGGATRNLNDYLLCFDFTTERFGTRLPLPFHPEFPSFKTVTLSWVRDEKLAVLYNNYRTFDIIEIWITTKIEPNAVSWSTFLRVDLRLINGLPDGFSVYYGARSFFIDEEKEVVVLFDIDRYKMTKFGKYRMVYMIGKGGYFKFFNMGEAPRRLDSFKLVRSSYVPSLVQVEINQLDNKEKKEMNN